MLPLFLLLILPSQVKADEPSIVVGETFHLSDTVLDTLNRIPETKHGAYYSFLDSGINYSSQVALINDLGTKGLSVNAGVAGDSNKTDWKAIASIAYDFGRLQDYGVNVPIVKYIGFEPYLVAGFGRINIKDITKAEKDIGIGVNILRISF